METHTYMHTLMTTNMHNSYKKQKDLVYSREIMQTFSQDKKAIISF